MAEPETTTGQDWVDVWGRVNGPAWTQIARAMDHVSTSPNDLPCTQHAGCLTVSAHLTNTVVAALDAAGYMVVLRG